MFGTHDILGSIASHLFIGNPKVYALILGAFGTSIIAYTMLLSALFTPVVVACAFGFAGFFGNAAIWVMNSSKLRYV